MKDPENACVWLLRMVAAILLGMVVTRITTVYSQPRQAVHPVTVDSH
ncbi:hypothetical protein JIN85_12425 [Luteolibacter pohnpeiensis]|uniref:Uncharacterized protein n=1 Tax=Luteolibacter pohnpeiensis TaxID=454153 RepID=A0A934VWW3_9BACT|nr:hypothetical protein [Luteolibacter pohnpeiensis]MBK1883223.1 hypothetical protein [Luteolibacter pohnpeiensis]